MNELGPLWNTARQAQRDADRANASIAAHEDLCALRYKTINGTLEDIKAILKWGGLALVSALAALAWA